MSQREYDDLAHYGVKGMRWGHRKEDGGSGLSTKKKVAIGVGAAATVAGAAFVAHKMGASGPKTVPTAFNPAKMYKDAGMSASQTAQATKLFEEMMRAAG